MWCLLGGLDIFFSVSLFNIFNSLKMQTTNDGERLTEVMADSKRVADIHAALETSLQIQGVELQLDLI